jgi:hypothetical protein
MRKAIKATFVDGSKLEPTGNKVAPSSRRPSILRGGLEK